MGKDYYKILGVDKSATNEEIKQAFRKLAHLHHPDKKGGDEAKFKEINEAYQVLGNEKKRQQFDQYGSSFDQQGGFGGGMNWDDFMSQARGGFSGGNMGGFDFGGIDLGDIFGDVFGFGGGGRGRSRREERGNDIQVDMQISLSEAAFGVKKEIELYKQTKCSHCHGDLAEPGTKVETCATCKGQGQVTRVQRTFIGNIQTNSVCPDCHGLGKKISEPCHECRGQGVVKKKEQMDIGIPSGIEDGAAIRYSGHGEAGAKGVQSGDLYVRVRIRPDKNFERRGDDLITTKKINFVQATLGDTVDVLTLDGEVSLKIPAGTQPGTRLRLKDRGMTRFERNDRGDLYVEVEVEIPTHISRAQRKLLEEFKKED